MTYAEAAEAMAAGFQRALNVQLVPGELTQGEWAAVERIREEKYASDAWTLKR